MDLSQKMDQPTNNLFTPPQKLTSSKVYLWLMLGSLVNQPPHVAVLGAVVAVEDAHSGVEAVDAPREFKQYADFSIFGPLHPFQAEQHFEEPVPRLGPQGTQGHAV